MRTGQMQQSLQKSTQEWQNKSLHAMAIAQSFLFVLGLLEGRSKGVKIAKEVLISMH
jgi:hypothetical protein